MEGKTVIMTVLLLSLMLGQLQVEGRKVCCQTSIDRSKYGSCIFMGGVSQSTCASFSGCKLVDGKCPPGWQKDILENSGDAVTEYCKLGCASSVCGAITTLQSSDASEIVNGAVEQCTQACSAICTKGSITAVETA